MEKQDILLKIKLELQVMMSLSDEQFEQRFSTSKHDNYWNDELFKRYQTSRIRLELLLEFI